MPAKLRDSYSAQELRRMGNIGDFVIENFLKDSLSEQEQIRLKLRLNTFYYLENHPQMTAYYKEKYPEMIALINNDPNKILEHYDQKEITHPNKVLNDGGNSINSYFDDDAFEQPIADMVKAVEELSIHMDEYLKKEKLTEAQLGYFMAFKSAIDALKTGGSYKNQMQDNNILFNVVNEGLADFTLNKGNLEPFYDKKTKELSFDPVDNDEFNWKDAIDSLNGSPLQESYKKAYNVASKWETLKQGGDAYRSELIALYDDFARGARKRFSMSQAAFDNVHEKGYLQNDYSGFVSGSRAPYNIQFEAEARSQLLKAGYPVSDISVLSQVYMRFKAIEKNASMIQTQLENPEETIKNNREAWEQLIAPGAITPAVRIGRIKNLAGYLLINDKVPELSSAVNERAKAKLNPFEERALSGNVKDFYDALCAKNVDPDLMKSSDEFKAMKETLKKLSEVDRGRNPEKYEFLKEKAIKDTEKYLKYKQEQMRETGKKHKRSETEALRVNTAVSILDGLKRIDKQDKRSRDLTDKRVMVDDKVNFETAKELHDAITVLDAGRSTLIQRINYIKDSLRSTQNDIDAIWENGIKSEGSLYYQNMSRCVKRCSELLEDPYSNHTEIKESLEALEKAAKAYKKDKEGVFTSPPTEGDAGNRYKAAKYMTENIPAMITAYNNMLKGLDNLKNKDSVPYKELPLADLRTAKEQVHNKFPQEFENAAANEKDQPKYDYFKIAEQQAKIHKMIKKFNPFMADNYNPEKNVDYYINLKPGMSTSELANAYMTKKYLDKLYKPGITKETLDELADDIDTGLLNLEASHLAKSPAFKKTVSTYPERAYSNWEQIDKRADELIKKFEDNVSNMLNSRPTNKDNPEGQPYDNMYHYAMAGSNGTYYSRCAEAIVNWMLVIPMGRTITEAIAADRSANPDDIVNTLKDNVTKYLVNDNKKFQKGLKFYIDDFSETEKLYKHMLKSYQKNEKDRAREDMAINIPERNSLNANIKNDNPNKVNNPMIK